MYETPPPNMCGVRVKLQENTTTTENISAGTATSDGRVGDLLENNDHSGVVGTQPEKFRSESPTKQVSENGLKTSFTRVAWRLYLALLLNRLVPTMYKTTRVYYLGHLPSEFGVNIASQLSWVVDILLRVVKESLIVPLFHVIGVTLDDARETVNRIKTGMVFAFIVYVLFAAVIAAAATPLVRLMAQDPEILNETVSYIRLEMAAVPFDGVKQFATVVFTLNQWRFHLYMLLLMRLVLPILFDTLFLSSFDFSLQLGVNGIAYGNIITNILLSVYSVSVLFLKYPKSHLRCKISVAWMKTWGVVGSYSGLDTLIRKIFYAMSILRMVNVIGEQETFWLANEFIWNWLLLPFLPLANVLKQDTGASMVPVIDHKLKTSSYALVTMMMALVWCASIPIWRPFLGTIMNIPEGNVGAIFEQVLMLTPAYILFVSNYLMKSVFIGKGKTILLAVQSILTYIPVHGIPFVFYLAGRYAPTLLSISIFLTVEKAVDFLITTAMYIWYLQRVEYKI